MYFNNNINFSVLTKNNRKKQLFSTDFNFEYSYKIGKGILGQNFEALLSDYAMLIVKPEALITNKVSKIISLLTKYNFEPVFFVFKKMSHIQVSEIWKYVWSASTLPRIIANEKFFSLFDSLIIILRNKQRNEDYATAYLCKLKGSANPEDRGPENFRSIIKPITPLLNHLHTADEPIDFIRETGILLEWDELTTMYDYLKSNHTYSFDAIQYSANAYVNAEYWDNPEQILHRYINALKSELRKCSTGSSNFIYLDKAIKQLINVSRSKDAFLDIDFLQNLKLSGYLNWSWDLLIILTQYIEYKTERPTLI